MIRPEDIFAATDGGLNIILDLYPQARDCVGAVNKKFKMRDERTASACLRRFNSQKYGQIWQVTDFGGEGHAENAIDLYMRENNLDRSRFGEAILQLASRYGVRDELNRNVNRADVRKREAHADEEDGRCYFETKDFTEAELKVLGPRVTAETVKALHWHSVKKLTKIKDRKATDTYSNDNYPVFIRECIVSPAKGDKEEVKFYKIYEPFNTDKGFRFMYTPIGKKPQFYVNGLQELKEAHRRYNEDEEKKWCQTHTDDEPYKPKKLPEAIICSGERDSLCCRSMGFPPLWFNSETYKLSVEEYKEIMKYTDTLYNIPDIDETGRRKGNELALRFIDIRTVWLPDWLATYHDNRGKPRKDLRDWMELRSEKRNFTDLLKSAMPARFWVSSMDKNGKLTHKINTSYLYNFLSLNGFHSLKNENSDDTQLVRVTGNIVKRVNAKNIREFIRKWVMDRYEDNDILNLVLDSLKLTSSGLESLYEVDLDFSSYTMDSQFFFFPNKTIEIKRTGDGTAEMQEYNQGIGIRNYVWEENVIKHSFRRMEDMFKVVQTVDSKGKPAFDIEVLSVKSKFFAYMINTSRIYWRKEIEERFETEGEAEAYREAHKFDIAGEGLSKIEIAEQKQNLLSKIFAFGYMLHHYKSPSRAWAPMAMDCKLGDLGECNGRSGKSFFFTVLGMLMKTVKLSGRNPKLMDNPHVFDQVNQYTQMLLIDDCDRYLNTGQFYDNITGPLTVNPKNNRSFTIPFEDSPKLAFTTNYVPSDFDPSTSARLLYLTFSDYYHQKTEDNNYRESRSIHSDFDKDLYDRAYTEDEWIADINFWLQCCKFYLSVSGRDTKISPPMLDIVRRKIKADMGENFEDWAYGYFSEDSDNLDTFIQRDKLFEEYRSFSNTGKITMQSFTKRLKAFAIDCPWVEELNPDEYKNASGRIQRPVEVAPNVKKTKDMVFLRSIKGSKPKETTEAKDLFEEYRDGKPF